VLQLQPAHRDALVNLGFILTEEGRAADAQDFLKAALALDPSDADTLYLLSRTAGMLGESIQMVKYLEGALESRPVFEEAFRDLIVALFNEGQIEEATRCCEEALARCPLSAELHFYRSNLHKHAGDLDAALASCEIALVLRPGLYSATSSFAALLEARLAQNPEWAVWPPSETPDLSSRPDGPSVAAKLPPRGPIDEAALRLARAYAVLGGAYQYQRAYRGARDAYERAIVLAPSVGEHYFNLGYHHQMIDELDLALTRYDEALAVEPEMVRARWARTMLHAPAFQEVGVDGARVRTGFIDALKAFEAWWDPLETDGDVFIGTGSPFYLTYQEESNLELMGEYGRLCVKAMQRWLIRQSFSTRPARPRGQRTRILIVSADVHGHSVWFALIKGWIQHIDRERFEVILLSLGSSQDEETEWARSHAEEFLRGPRPLHAWVEEIRQLNPEVIIYPAIGLDATTVKLASLRLATVQVTSWGQPDTSGLPTIDYFLSGEDFEPEDGQEHYTETLVRLVRLGNAYQGVRTRAIEPDWASIALDPTRPVLICAGTPFKYQPSYDSLYIAIAKRLPRCQLVFFRLTPEHLADQLQERLRAGFNAHGLSFEHHVRFIAVQPRERFHGLLERADVLLDTIGFSGYNTAVQAIECDLPVVTQEGGFLRGRLASGILRAMNLTELIADSEERYVQKVVELVEDRAYRDRVRRDIARRRSVLIDDAASVRSLEEFLTQATGPERARDNPGHVPRAPARD
jgi:tetratricopeptide (TPR) repeat protein